ncbi:MAG: hypothetical protein GY943_27570, partial [Chloroflexi bacterium]|nr:hypothetical protein [Chloroflexota bacterium]
MEIDDGGDGSSNGSDGSSRNGPPSISDSSHSGRRGDDQRSNASAALNYGQIGTAIADAMDRRDRRPAYKKCTITLSAGPTENVVQKIWDYTFHMKMHKISDENMYNTIVNSNLLKKPLLVQWKNQIMYAQNGRIRPDTLAKLFQMAIRAWDWEPFVHAKRTKFNQCLQMHNEKLSLFHQRYHMLLTELRRIEDTIREYIHTFECIAMQEYTMKQRSDYFIGRCNKETKKFIGMWHVEKRNSIPMSGFDVCGELFEDALTYCDLRIRPIGSKYVEPTPRTRDSKQSRNGGPKRDKYGKDNKLDRRKLKKLLAVSRKHNDSNPKITRQLIKEYNSLVFNSNGGDKSGNGGGRRGKNRRGRGNRRERNRNKNRRNRNRNDNNRGRDNRKGRNRGGYRGGRGKGGNGKGNRGGGGRGKGGNRNKRGNDNSNNGGRQSNITCYNCDGKGHYARDCPTKSSGTGQRNHDTVPRGRGGVNALNVDGPPNPNEVLGNESVYTANQRQEFQNLDRGNKPKHKRTVTINTNNNTYHGQDGSYPYSFQLFATDVSAITESAELKFLKNTFNLDRPVTKLLKIRGYEPELNGGKYIGVIDTGANIAAMKTQFAVQNKFPIWSLKRNITIDTANGQYPCNTAAVVDILNDIDPKNEYWMRTIFYLLDNIHINIIIDRRTMRLLGLDITPLKNNVYHPSTNTQEWADEDNFFWEQLLDTSILLPPNQRSENTEIESKSENIMYDNEGHILSGPTTVEGGAEALQWESQITETVLDQARAESKQLHTIGINEHNIHHFTPYIWTEAETLRKQERMRLIHRTFDPKNVWTTDPLHDSSSSTSARIKLISADNTVIGEIVKPIEPIPNPTLLPSKKGHRSMNFIKSTWQIPNEVTIPSIYASHIDWRDKPTRKSMMEHYTDCSDQSFIESTAIQANYLNSYMNDTDYLNEHYTLPMDFDGKIRSNDGHNRSLYRTHSFTDTPLTKKKKKGLKEVLSI